MKQRRSILVVSNLFPTPTDPIRGVFTYQLVKRLTAICDVTVVCPLPWFPGWLRGQMFRKWADFAQIPSVYDWQGITVHCPKYPMIPRVSEAAQAALMFPSLYRTVKQLHRLKKFDAVNTQWLYPDGVAAGLVASTLKLPHVLTALGCDANLFLTQRHKRTQIEWAMHKAQRITVVSDALRQFIEGHGSGGKPVDVIPNGVDAEVFHPRDKDECARSLGVARRGKTVLFVGQLLEVKGVIYLIEAVDRLVKAGMDVFVNLVGEGSNRPIYEAEIERRGLSSRMRLVGNRPHGEVALWMGASDVFCLPSIREGFPNVVLEALFSGRPVVASDTGGIPEMVSEKNGLLVEPKDATALANALGEALSKNWDPASIVDSVSHLSWERAAETYLRSMEEAIRTFSSQQNDL